MPPTERSDESIFAAALEKPTAAERAAFLEGACAGDEPMRARVAELIRSHEEAGSFLGEPPVAAPPTIDFRPILEGPGSVIDRYKLLQKIGEGGFGAVYMAEQREPVKRRVALKIIKLGMDTEEVIARFEAERQALALMDHSNIARVFDAGTTANGRPYFVMELVKGVPITEFCDANNLPARERLALFADVCQAVQHAHQKGVIHRDLKPSNILVTLHDGRPVPKVIDFGVAKALNQELTERTLFTAYGHMIGTPQYMSPEQAEMSGLDVDTRSDVYSLGVLLFELLTGTTALDSDSLRRAGYLEMQRLIKDQEAPRPSLRLSTLGEKLTVVARHRQTDPKQLQQMLRGELDWIVLKALEKERGRRYESPSTFAADVRRYLEDRPVEACPPSLAYRARKFVRRNRGAVAAAGALMSMLVLGLIGTIVGLLHARNEALRANLASREANAARADSERQRQQAIAAGSTAALERDNAVAAREELGRTLYASRMNLIQAAWEANDLENARRLLKETTPAPGSPDPRGFEWHHWDRKVHSEIRSWTLPTFTNMGQNLSTDGSLAAAGRERGNLVVALWDVAGARIVRTLRGSPMEAGEAARFPIFWPGGEELQVFRRFPPLDVFNLGEGGFSRHIWDLRSGREISVSSAPAFLPAGILATSPDGRRMVTYARSRGDQPGSAALKIRDTGSGLELLTLDTSDGSVRSAGFSPDGHRLVALAESLLVPSTCRLVVWDATPRPVDPDDAR